MIVYTGSDMPLYAFSLFLPSIINQVRPVSYLPSPSPSASSHHPPISVSVSASAPNLIMTPVLPSPLPARYVLVFPCPAIHALLILRRAGFKATPANLLTVPVYVFACLITCLVGYVADRRGQRGLINM